MNNASLYHTFLITVGVYLASSSWRGILKRLAQRVEDPQQKMGMSFFRAGAEGLVYTATVVGLLTAGAGIWHP